METLIICYSKNKIGFIFNSLVMIDSVFGDSN